MDQKILSWYLINTLAHNDCHVINKKDINIKEFFEMSPLGILKLKEKIIGAKDSEENDSKNDYDFYE